MISAGEEIVLLPNDIKSRIRGMQSHGDKIEQGFAGERIAVNLADVSRGDVERGMVAAKSGCFTPSEKLLVGIRYLPYNEKPMKSRINCRFHVLTSRVSAEIFLLNRERLMPGEKGFAMVRLSNPIIVSYGDPFVIRGYGIYTTMGGGGVLNPALSSFNKSHLTEEYLSILAKGEQKQLIQFSQKKRKQKVLRSACCAG